jgi:serine phosphatase RsbU (regulator of sigma subunit)
MYATLYSADAHEGLGEYDTAFTLLEKYIALKDSIFNAEKSEQSARFKILYQTEKKERELALLSKESEIQRLEIQRQRNVAAQRQTKLALLSKEQELERLRFLQEKAAQEGQLKAERQKRELDSLDFLRREEEKQAQISLLEKDQRLKEAALARNQLMLFAGGGFVLLLLLLVILAWRNLQQKRRANEALIEKNEEINQQKEEISIIAESLKGANTTITNANQKITSSINYAQRIQQAILPTTEELKAAFPTSFVLYQPKDIVSGDFYWLQRFENQTLLAAIDCTGHGVPGAFMSVIANDLFREVAQKLENENTLRTDTLLAQVDKMLRQTLHQEKENTVSDGMDVAVIQYYPKEKEVYFSGAKNPILVQQGHSLVQIKGDRIALGGSKHAKQERKFTVHEIKIEKPTWFYMYSDGIQDQFGGPQNRKLGKKRLINALCDNLAKTESEQQKKLEDYLHTWQTQSKEPQTDDRLLLGVKLG